MAVRKRKPVGRPAGTKVQEAVSSDELKQSSSEKNAILGRIGKTQTEILFEGFDQGKEPKQIIDEAYENYGLVIDSQYAYSRRVIYNKERGVTSKGYKRMSPPEQKPPESTEDLLIALIKMIRKHGSEKVSELVDVAVKLKDL